MIRIRLNGKIFLFLIIILILYTGQARGQPAPPENNLYNKVMCGYQGWFGAPGDDPYGNLSWKHWCIDGKEPTPLTITIDSWPDYTEYPQDQLFFPAGYNWNYPDGSPAGFFSSNMESTIMLHFKWMRDYGIDGIFLQRFTRSFTDPFYKERREITLNYILKAAAIYGLKVAVMYDVTGTPLTEISQRLTDDWIDLVNQMRIHEHPSYQYHPDHNGQSLPVVAVWGFGFNGTGTKGQAGQVITFFKTHTNPIYRATLMGGVPGYWRFGDRDSKAQYELVYAGFDILSPWTVGRFGDEGGVHWWRNQIMAGDMQLARGRGQQYIPVAFPGFSNYNLRRNVLDKTRASGQSYIDTSLNARLNSIPRNGGHFMWSQFYQWTQAGNNMLYIAMFDEVDEGTAIFKVASDSGKVPDESLFLHLGMDGYTLKSDYYLWLTGSAGFIIKQQLPFPTVKPERFHEDWFRLQRQESSSPFGRAGEVRIDIRMDEPSVSRLEIYKKPDNGQFLKVLTLTRGALQNNQYIYMDRLFDNTTYNTYILVGFNSSGFPIGLSDMKRI